MKNNTKLDVGFALTLIGAVLCGISIVNGPILALVFSFAVCLIGTIMLATVDVR